MDAEFLQRGLSSEEVAARTARGETNATPHQTSRTYTRIIYDNSVNPVNISLFAIGGLLVGLGLIGDAVLTAGLVIGNIVVGVFQEARAKRQLDKIAVLTRPTATVVRDGEERTIDPDAIVLGDLIRVRAGDQVQVDGPVLAATGLSVDEALLTGESDLILKRPGDALNSGTFCMTGEGSQLAEVVGAETVSHKITARARAYRSVRTPLQREVGIIIWVMAGLVGIIGIAVATSFISLYHEVPLVEGTRAAAVVVALVPQGLWFMITVAYSMAVVRTARSGVLIQRLNAVEAISRVDVLCLDKTGTLTSNALHVDTIKPITLPEVELREHLGAFAASASFRNRTSSSILEACPGTPQSVTQEVVFDSARKWSALVFGGALYVLGAPEILRPYVDGTHEYESDVETWADEGLRVLLFSGLENASSIDLEAEQPLAPGSLTPYGLIVLRDELRHDAAETVARFSQGGVRLKILSGDNPDTVAALARQAGFDGENTAVAGPDLNGLDDEQLSDTVEEATIFGRVSPDNKEQLVQALQRRGHYVAMIGDGVNDIPALKAAHVAAVMRSGSPATRSVADIVLLEDSFGALSYALLEGQRIRQGMEGVVRLFLVRTLAISLVILGVAIMSDAFPITPRQSAIVAALTVGIPAVALAAWARPGHSPHLLLPGAVAFVLPSAITLGAVGLVVYAAFLHFHSSVNDARTALTLFGVLCGVALIPFSVLSQNEWLHSDVLTKRPRLTALAGVMLVLYVVASIVGPLRSFYELQVLVWWQYAAICGAVVVWALLLRVLVRSGFDEWLGDKTQRLLESRGAVPTA